MLSLTLAKFDKFSRISRSYASILNEVKTCRYFDHENHENKAKITTKTCLTQGGNHRWL